MGDKKSVALEALAKAAESREAAKLRNPKFIVEDKPAAALPPTIEGGANEAKKKPRDFTTFIEKSLPPGDRE